MKDPSRSKWLTISLLTACAVALCTRAEATPIALGIGSFGSPLVTFSEVALGTPLNGLTINGFGFAETVPNASVASGGSGNTNNVTQPAALGFNFTVDVITVTMPSLMSGFGFGYSILAAGNVVPNAVTVTLFRGTTNLGSLGYTASLDPIFPGGFMGVGDDTTPFDSVRFSFTSTASGFDFDNIRAIRADSAVPEPTTMVLLGSGFAAAAARRFRRAQPLPSERLDRLLKSVTGSAHLM